MAARGAYPAFGALVLLGGLLAGCTAPAAPSGALAAPAPASSGREFMGVQALRQSGDILEFTVAMRGARSEQEVSDYARCIAAGLAQGRGFGFARHVVTNVAFEAGVWRANAVYSISRTLPAGRRTIDVEVQVRDCESQGIPTV